MNHFPDTAKARRFLDRYNIDLAVERIDENPFVPASWTSPEMQHFQVAILANGREVYFPVTFADAYLIDGPLPRYGRFEPSGETILALIAQEMLLYEQRPEVERWAAWRGVELTPDLVESFGTFAREQRELQRFFGEQYQEFLEIARPADGIE